MNGRCVIGGADTAMMEKMENEKAEKYMKMKNLKYDAEMAAREQNRSKFIKSIYKEN